MESAIRLLLVIFILSITGLKLFAPTTNIVYTIEVQNDKKMIAANRLKLRQQEFIKFLDALGAKESSNNWKTYNQYGYIGEWQLGKAALKDIGYNHITFQAFKNNPYIFPRAEQLIAVTKLIDLNTKKLEPYIIKYVGDTIKGIKITKSGILAGAHLGGPGGVIKFLDSNGSIDRKDALGTPLSHYFNTFNNYNL